MASCRHRGAWLICGGRWAWCYECGGVRCEGWKRWVKPTGDRDNNPWQAMGGVFNGPPLTRQDKAPSPEGGAG